MKIEKPIFIIGTGRCGSTIFHRMFSKQPNVAWLSSLCNKFPNKPEINKFITNAMDYSILGKCLARKIKPGECYGFWETHCKGFRQPCRDLIPEDVTNKVRENVSNALARTLTKKRYRLLVKITGWPRIGFLHEIFNDAKFIHVVRDGRAVVNSLITRDWWWGWRGPQNWRWGELTPSQKEEWEKFNKSFVALAAIQWKILMDAVEKGEEYIDGHNFLEIQYEELCASPISVFKKAVDFCNLEWSKKFETMLNDFKMKNTNYKWQNDLTPYQQFIIEEITCKYLKKYNYLS